MLQFSCTKYDVRLFNWSALYITKAVIEIQEPTHDISVILGNAYIEYISEIH